MRKHCWFVVDRICRTPNDCRLAGYCCNAFNPHNTPSATKPLWFWEERL